MTTHRHKLLASLEEINVAALHAAAMAEEDNDPEVIGSDDDEERI